MIQAKMNISRMHDVIEGRVYGRQCGKTTAVLCTAIGYADFSGEDIFILHSTSQQADYNFKRFIHIAHEMAFYPIHVIRHREVRINKRIYRFEVKREDMPYLDNMIFEDLI